jgi:hypothetical protein
VNELCVCVRAFRCVLVFVCVCVCVLVCFMSDSSSNTNQTHSSCMWAFLVQALP